MTHILLSTADDKLLVLLGMVLGAAWVVICWAAHLLDSWCSDCSGSRNARYSSVTSCCCCTWSSNRWERRCITVKGEGLCATLPDGRKVAVTGDTMTIADEGECIRTLVLRASRFGDVKTDGVDAKGENVTVGRIETDGGDVAIQGSVQNGVDSDGGDVWINGNVTGDVRSGGGDIAVKGAVSGAIGRKRVDSGSAEVRRVQRKTAESSTSDSSSDSD